MVRTLIAVRTHRINADSVAAYDRYLNVTHADVVFACDERASPVDAGDRQRVGYDEARLRRMGLYAHPQCGWRCGDYQYYTLWIDRPGYDVYWLIEPDVFINTSDVDAFFASFRDDTADFLAARYGPRDAQWDWYARIAPHFPDVFGCVFPVTRVTGPAIAHLFTMRRDLSSRPDAATPLLWPNDESFTASALSAAQFRCADLNAPGRIVRTEISLRTGVTHDPAYIAKLAPDGLIYHPVRPLSPVLLDAERRLRVLAERPRSTRQMRAHLMWLLRVAETCIRDGAHSGAALAPMLVAADTINRLRVAAHSTGSTIGTDPNLSRKADKLLGLLQRQFEVFPGDTCVGTAHVAVSRVPWRSSVRASAGDFPQSDGRPIRRLATGFVLPYAFDMTEETLLLTVHTVPAEHLSAPSLHVSQRDYCAAVIRVPWAHLSSLFSRSRGQLRLVFVVPPDDDVTLLDQSLRRITGRCVAAPGALSQLRAAQRRLLALPETTRSSLIRSAVVPFLDVRVPQENDSLCIVRPAASACLIMPEIAAVFPAATFLFVRGNDGREAGKRQSEQVLNRLKSTGIESRWVQSTDLVHDAAMGTSPQA